MKFKGDIQRVREGILRFLNRDIVVVLVLMHEDEIREEL